MTFAIHVHILMPSLRGASQLIGCCELNRLAIDLGKIIYCKFISPKQIHNAVPPTCTDLVSELTNFLPLAVRKILRNTAMCAASNPFASRVFNNCQSSDAAKCCDTGPEVTPLSPVRICRRISEAPWVSHETTMRVVPTGSSSSDICCEEPPHTNVVTSSPDSSFDGARDACVTDIPCS